MASNKNIFAATNPAQIMEALWKIISASDVPLENTLLFLPSRRAVRGVEKMLVEKHGHAIVLPHIVALGEGVDEAEEFDTTPPDTISNTERVVILAKLLSMDSNIKTISTALPIAHDLVRMMDYLENEGIDIAQLDITKLVDEKYAEHFRGKANMLQILTESMPAITKNRKTTTAKRNEDIRAWIPFITDPNCKYKSVIVCGSTASVPSTADLMAAIAQLPFGKIILSGKIAGRTSDLELQTNPYHSEYMFLSRIGCTPDDVQPIDVGSSNIIDFMNASFGNDPKKPKNTNAVSHCHLVECDRESTEALAVAEITARALGEKNPLTGKEKTVLIITPDAAANQRIAAAFAAQKIAADFSGGRPATMHNVGRAILNMLDECIENKLDTFDNVYIQENYNLFRTLVTLVDTRRDIWFPSFNPTDETALPIWIALREMSDALINNGITLSINDARAFIADALSTVVIRSTPQNDTRVCVLGTIESRMQTADVVILTGLNEGMFPARGYENAWLPRAISEKIGLPSPDRKVSLMSLDFMNLSCGTEVYWLRSEMSGGVETPESRFLSRVTARGGEFDTTVATDILSTIHASDDLELHTLDYSAPTPPSDWSDVHVTELEKLIHNPYVFYVVHILRLHKKDDYWEKPDVRKFGTLIHDVAKDAKPEDTPEMLVSKMDAMAHELLQTDGVMFRFWHRRFIDIAPFILNEIRKTPNAHTEIPGFVDIPVGKNGAKRTVRAYADRIVDGLVIDFKTGGVPTKPQLLAGTMPQLPLEAYMLQTGGFDIPTTALSKTPKILFLQLQKNHIEPYTYTIEETQDMITAAVEKVTQLFNHYSAGDNASYEYLPTNDAKYKTFDDLARVNDLQ